MDKEETQPENEKEEVKSTAIVKYSVPKPAQFMKLQCNTDLNLPPSNWLSSSADSYGLQHVLYHQKGFSSFRMAHMFPDVVGEVDVVSDAENIKNLLKIPYHKGHISMMVHRVENTLLLDDFDIYKHLLRTAETEWEWLRKFFFENINSETCEEDRNLYISQRRREALKQRSLVSKFLYHSLVETDSPESADSSLNKNHPLPVEGPILPEPSPAEEVPSSETVDHKFNRNVVWTFEDIEMLLGTDMPIFGGGTHPCISLRLRDMNKPISVLTGIDYWLDNLMSNVPEVVMCYHLNGIVQKYELIKTEDLPRLDNSKFSPKLIRDVAQSILSFLKSNATKAGHTYWLFKGKDEEVVKLYDLTSLCTEKDVENGQNPFTIPVAMLLYRVARNMKHSSERRQPGTIRMLLKNCVKLLPEEKYPEIVTSSHYMLSDLFVPATTIPESPNLDETENDDNDSIYDDDLRDDNKDSATKILVLDQPNSMEKFDNYYKAPPPISGGLEERCLQAIQHVSSGLSCLKYFPEQSCSPEKEKKDEDEEVHMANKFEPIPMPYAKIGEEIKPETSSKKGKKKEKNKKKQRKDVKETENALLLKNNVEAQPLPTWQHHTPMDNISWKDHLKTLLYEKAVLVYATLSEYYFANGNFGSSLRALTLLARCQLVMSKLFKPNPTREKFLVGRCGDCCVMLVQNWEKCDTFKEQLQNPIAEDLKIMEQLEQDERNTHINIGKSSLKCVFIYDIRTIEQILLKAIECYEVAYNTEKCESMLRRLGNGLNEMAAYYLNIAKTSKTNEDIVDACKKGEPYLVRGLEVFEKVKDDANLSLLYSNMGHLNRLMAYANSPAERGSLTPKEKFHYKKAFTYYRDALQVLGDRKHCPVIWDAVKWEVSTALFNMGCIMHDYPSETTGTAEAEKEVIEYLQMALKYCDLDEENPKFPLYQYRAGLIHYRLGSLYHNHIYKLAANDSSRKNMIQLTKINYTKAASLFFASADAVNYLTCQMQRVALSESLAESTNDLNSKLKHLQHCLEIVIDIDNIVQMIAEQKIDVSEEKAETNDSGKVSFSSCYSLLVLVKDRLQHILKSLIKICLSKPPPNKHCGQFADLYKRCYKTSFDLKDNMDFKHLVSKLHNVLRCIKADISELDVIL